MRNLILQYASYLEKPKFKDVPNPKQEWWKLSRNSIQAYARSIKADYIFMTEGAPYSGYFSSFMPFLGNLYRNYDNVCFIDSDVLATKNSKNIFQDSSIDYFKLGIHKAACGPMRVSKFGKIEEWQNVEALNSGVVLYPRKIHEDFKNFIRPEVLAVYGKNIIDGKDDKYWYDQNVFWDFAKEFDYHDLHYQYNYLMTFYDHRFKKEQSLVHYHWNMKYLLELDYEEDWILK